MFSPQPGPFVRAAAEVRAVVLFERPLAAFAVALSPRVRLARDGTVWQPAVDQARRGCAARDVGVVRHRAAVKAANTGSRPEQLVDQPLQQWVPGSTSVEP